MSYPAWDPPYRITTIRPGRNDLFVFTLVDGKVATLWSIDRFDEALSKAAAFHRDHPKCQIKVLAMDGTEAFNMLGIKPSRHPQPLDPADRALITERLTDIVRNSSDGHARRDAFDLLQTMGSMPL